MSNFFPKSILSTFFLLTLTMMVGGGGGVEEESEVKDEVKVMTDDNFEKENEALQNSLVMFHAPWCGHCRALSPEFSKAATLLKNDVEVGPVALAKVDCTGEGKETCGRFNIRGYPTLKIFKNGEVMGEYRGPRDSQGMVKYMRNELKNEKEREDRAEL